MIKAAARTQGKSQGWRFAIWLILAAFTLQAYVAQTHIHDAAPIAKIVTGASDSKAPADKNQPDCPFCQAVAQAGAFHLSAAPLLLLSSAFIFMAAPIHSAPASFDAAAHSWRSRAPPQH